jgi:predicted acylesterase/phospholipase RssA
VPESELRLALVLNGGVSLAVWIGGVLHEIDRLQREDGLYAQALRSRSHSSVRVDVIAGASAGGINGALLAAAIKTGRPLRDARGRSLRELWTDLGDFDRLLRPATEKNPPSLLRGDKLMVGEIEKVLDALLAEKDAKEVDHPLYLYITSTDLHRGTERTFATSHGAITALDHRVVFRFCAGADAEAPDGLGTDQLAARLPLDAANAGRLARAARASSSFPSAFPPYEAWFEGEPDTVHHYLVDGGILDNQPFNPVLDRIRLMPVEQPVERAVLFVVPYVSGAAPPTGDPDRSPPGLVPVIGSVLLASDLSRLQSLERIVTDRQDGLAARAATELANARVDSAIVPAASKLYGLYREVRAAELVRVALSWMASPPTIGAGERGSDETRTDPPADDRTIDVPPPPELDVMLAPEDDWERAVSGWRDPAGAWCWGFSRAEQFARIALSWLADEAVIAGVGEAALRDARSAASALATHVQQAMRAQRSAYKQPPASAGMTPEEQVAVAARAFVTSFDAVDAQPVNAAFEALVAALGSVLPEEADVRRQLAAFEVVSNALGTTTTLPPKFAFYRVSASVPILGHASATPETKLAGMLLGHFAAFLKRSWRVNDWMWGRLDAVAWIGQMLGQDDAWLRRQHITILREELVALDAAAAADEVKGFASDSDVSTWRRENADVLKRLGRGDAVDDDEIVDVFRRWRRPVPPSQALDRELRTSKGRELITHAAAVASRLVSGSGGKLPRPARAALGTTRGVTAVAYGLSKTWSRGRERVMALRRWRPWRRAA